MVCPFSVILCFLNTKKGGLPANEGSRLSVPFCSVVAEYGHCVEYRVCLRRDPLRAEVRGVDDRRRVVAVSQELLDILQRVVVRDEHTREAVPKVVRADVLVPEEPVHIPLHDVRDVLPRKGLFPPVFVRRAEKKGCSVRLSVCLHVLFEDLYKRLRHGARPNLVSLSADRDGAFIEVQIPHGKIGKLRDAKPRQEEHEHDCPRPQGGGSVRWNFSR